MSGHSKGSSDDQPTASTTSLIQARCQLFKEALQGCITNNKPIARVDFQDTINCGDLLIWLGEKQYLNDLGVTAAYDCSMQSYDAEEMRACIGDGLILMSGGGNFGDIYYLYQKFRERVLADFPDNEVIVFPQTVKYLDATKLQHTKKCYRDHGKLTLCARDDESLAFLQMHFPFCKIIKAPDAANFLGPQVRVNQPVVDVLWLSRTDRESCFDLGKGIRERITEPEKIILLPVSAPLENGVSIKVSVAKGILLTDWYQVTLNGQAMLDCYQALSFEQKAQAQLEWAKAILGLGKVVITDRLHGHILCTLMNLPHVVLDNNYRKVGSYIDSWLPRPNNVKYADNPEQALELAHSLLIKQSSQAENNIKENTPSKSIVISPLARLIKDDNYIRHCSITRVNQGTEVDQRELWFEFSKSVEPPHDDDCDSYLLIALMGAMREARKIRVQGSVSRLLLSNLVEYQAVWHKWLPNVYNIIDIEVDIIRDDEAPVHGAVCAFSGGVDAAFSVWRHSQNKVSYRSQKINLCSLIHGFDIALKDTTAFYNVSQAAKTTLADVDIKLKPVRTNAREVAAGNWDHVHSCALVATLGQLKLAAGTCIIGSSEPYDSLVIPWGSSPITDHLLSSGDFVVMHDGAAYNRTEKVKEIIAWPAAVKNLRVCWQGILQDKNCGQCEKCIRTQLNFLATGNPIPEAFSKKIDVDIDLENYSIKGNIACAEWNQMLTYARAHQVDGKWLLHVERIIKNGCC